MFLISVKFIPSRNNPYVARRSAPISDNNTENVNITLEKFPLSKIDYDSLPNLLSDGSYISFSHS